MQPQEKQQTNQINKQKFTYFLKLQSIFYIAGISNIYNAIVYTQYNTGQTLFKACTTFQDAQRQHISTTSAPNAPCHNDNILIASLGIKSYLQSSFQLLFYTSVGSR